MMYTQEKGLSMFSKRHMTFNNIRKNKIQGMWGDFPSLYSRFYKVIMHGSTNATNEGRIQM
jgi:hypothetical protein